MKSPLYRHLGYVKVDRKAGYAAHYFALVKHRRRLLHWSGFFIALFVWLLLALIGIGLGGK